MHSIVPSSPPSPSPAAPPFRHPVREAGGDRRTRGGGRRARDAFAFAGATLAALLIVTSIATSAHAQTPAPDDWPCVQGFVPEVSPAVLWPLPIGPELAGAWREDPATRELATRLGQSEALDDAARAAIDAFAGSVEESAREDALTRLADGTVAVANERRAVYLDGIRRYTRQQIAIAGQIESTLNRLAELDDAAAAGATGSPSDEAGEARSAPGADDANAPDGADDTTVAGRRDVEETLAWHERLYDQRERSIRALCERPVELEELISETLRELAYRLPGA